MSRTRPSSTFPPCDRPLAAYKPRYRYVVNNFTLTDNIVGIEKRRRVGAVVAEAHERLALYQARNKEYVDYAVLTQQESVSSFSRSNFPH